MNIIDILEKAIERKASDIHITVGLPPLMRINTMLMPFGDEPLKPDDTEKMAKQILTPDQLETLKKLGEIDLSYALPNISRFRVNVYKQRSSYSIAFRSIFIKVPTIDGLGFPDTLKDLVAKPRGLVLVTGPTGSGKSTTLAAMVNHINLTRNCHVLTLEEPIEYLHKHGKSMINQREIGTDSLSFSNALRAALREDPDVILVGEMRDQETIAIAITAAETGHLVMSTLHTIGAAQTIDRIIDVFPPFQQQQIKTQLSNVIEGVISQQLLPTSDGKGMIAALEIMMATGAIRNLIREGKTHQIDTIIQTSTKVGMKTMDYSLSELLRRGKISREEAELHCADNDMLRRYLLQAGSL